MPISKEILKTTIKHLNGHLPVYKPAGLCQRRLCEGLKLDMYFVFEHANQNYGRRIDFAHATYLEPFAEGVTTILLGDKVRSNKNYVLANCIYRAKIEFGVEREFNSIDGRVLSRSAAEHVTSDLIEKTLPRFTGIIEQDRCPGYRFYSPDDVKCGQHGAKYAERPPGSLPEAIELLNSMYIPEPADKSKRVPQKYPYLLPARSLLVESIELSDFVHPVAELTISCHGCFRARKFASDLADLLGTKASVVELSRIKEGPIMSDDLRVFRVHELQVELYLDRMRSLRSLYRDFDDQMDTLWKNIET